MASDEETKKHLDTICHFPATTPVALLEAAVYFEAMAAELNEARKLAVNAELRNVRFKAESTRGTVEALEWAADVFWNGSNFSERRKELLARIAELKQQSASQAQPEFRASQTTEHPHQKEPQPI